jgi:hypothetical protein
VKPLRAITVLASAAALLAPASALAASAAPPGVDLTNADRCDFLDPSVCLYPWPNDYFTVRDRHTATGRRLALNPLSTPANKNGVHIDPTDQNRADGFSPGNLIITKVPGLDNQQAFQRTGAVPITDVARSFDPRQPIVVINARTLRRQLIWSEIDANAKDPKDATLLIRPAVNFDEGGHYIVALRNLKDASGNPISASPAFRLYRDRHKTHVPLIERRRHHMEWLFKRLRRAGIERNDLYLTWDFTVASERSLASRALHIRDQAFAGLGDRNLADLRVRGSAPPFTVTSVQNFAPCGADGCGPGENDEIARQVQGTFAVPCYLDKTGCPPGSRLNLGADGLPQRLPGNTIDAHFICNIPRAALGHPARPSLYGHGLFGNPDEINAGNVKDMSAEHDFVFCGTPWIGMSDEDVGQAITILQDLSRFPTLADRMQQSFLDFDFLGRLMIHPQGFVSNPAFRFGNTPAIDTHRLFYDGNSQGGIAGGALTALAPDFNRAVLGVPGMNYSTLLQRSVDFDTYAIILVPYYPSELERPLSLSLIQLLWDRAEANGYAEHMTSRPYPNTPAHTVLLDAAFGDHQVSYTTAEVEARTIGARIREPALDAGRSWELRPFFGIPPIRHFPYNGSALVMWDSGPLRSDGHGGTLGTPAPPTTDTPPRLGNDPHELPRREASARLQKSEFLQVNGRLIDVCDDHPCYDGGWTGP